MYAYELTKIYNMHTGGVSICLGMYPHLSWVCFLQKDEALGHLLQAQRASLHRYAREQAHYNAIILTSGDHSEGPD